jgi:hypothetical protein
MEALVVIECAAAGCRRVLILCRRCYRGDRYRGQSFAFLPHRFLRDGFLSSVSPDELCL